MVVTFGSRETGPPMLRNQLQACGDLQGADRERNNSACGAKMPCSAQIGLVAQTGRAGVALKALDTQGRWFESNPFHSLVVHLIHYAKQEG